MMYTYRVLEDPHLRVLKHFIFTQHNVISYDICNNITCKLDRSADNTNYYM